MVTILLAAGELRDGTMVRKPTGNTIYTLRTDIKLYGEGAQVVRTDANVRFLVSDRGDINIIPCDRMLALDLGLEEAIDYLKEIRDASYSHK